MSFLRTLVNLIYDPRCYLCKCRVGEIGLCADCFNSLDFNTKGCSMCAAQVELIEHKCLSCIQNPKSFDKLHFMFNYNDSVAFLVSKYKFCDETHLVKYLSKFYVILLKSDYKNSIILPVPIHRTKLFTRNYNHSGLIANYISKILKIKIYHNVLYKKSHTKSQISLNGVKRLKNLKNIFAIRNPEIVKGKDIILIDDVITTGTTVNECSKVLKSMGAKTITVVALAKVKGRLKI